MNQKGLAAILIIILGTIILTGSVVGAWYTRILKIPNIPPPGCLYEQGDPILYCETFQERLDRQNPVLFPSIQPNSTNKPLSPNDRPNMTDETVDWKTYTDQDYKFSFKYPLYAKITGSGDIGQSPNFTGRIIDFQKGTQEFDISVYKDNQSSNIRPNQPEVTINGNKWLVEYQDPTKNNCADQGGLGNCTTQLTYQSSIDNRMVMITFRGFDREDPFVKQLVSTFKFLN